MAPWITSLLSKKGTAELRMVLCPPLKVWMSMTSLRDTCPCRTARITDQSLAVTGSPLSAHQPRYWP
ncbi:hypothetical protein D9M71_218300 [compost metagenome]